MTVYEYAPAYEKKKEKLLSGGCLGLAAALYLGAQIPSAPLPWLFQMLATALLSVVILLTSVILLRRYVYRIQRREDGELDFIIEEYTGRRKATVCRVSVASVLSVDVWNSSRKKGEAKGEGLFFSYAGVLFDQTKYLVRVQERDVLLRIRICADERLLAFLRSDNSEGTSENTV